MNLTILFNAVTNLVLVYLVLGVIVLWKLRIQRNKRLWRLDKFFFYFFEALAGFVLLGASFIVLSTTDFSGNPFLWTVFNQASLWHVLSLEGLVVFAAFVGLARKSLLFGALSGYLVIGLHDVFYVPLDLLWSWYTKGFSQFMQALYNNGLYFGLLVPILLIYPLLYRDVKWKQVFLGLAIVFVMWLLAGFPQSLPPGSEYFRNVFVSALEIAVWLVTMVITYVATRTAKLRLLLISR